MVTHAARTAASDPRARKHTTESTKSSNTTIDVYFEPSHTHEKSANDDAESTAHSWSQHAPNELASQCGQRTTAPTTSELVARLAVHTENPAKTC